MAIKYNERHGNLAVVTGAGQGLGRAIALRLVRGGYRVAVLDINMTTAGETVQLLTDSGGEAIAVECNVCLEESVSTAIVSIIQKFGRIDTLINNAGVIHQPAEFNHIALQDVSRVMDVNFTGVLNMCRACLPHLREAQGSIVNITSNAGLRPRAYAAVYNASKAAAINLTYTLAAELAPTVRVNSVAPSVADTQMLDFLTGEDPEGAIRESLVATIPMGRVATGDDIAAAVEFLVSDDAAFITGVVLPVDGGRMVS